jgi:hypothetical protein
MIRHLIPIVIAIVTVAAVAKSADAQVTEPRKLSATPTRVATLEEILVNTLRATRNDQKAYIKFLVKQVDRGKLEARLVLAIGKKAIQRNRYYPFPYFERAMHFEANKRNVFLPPVQQFATTRILPNAVR